MQHRISYLNTEFDTTTIYASLVLVGYRCMFNMETFQIVVGLLQGDPTSSVHLNDLNPSNDLHGLR